MKNNPRAVKASGKYIAKGMGPREIMALKEAAEVHLENLKAGKKTFQKGTSERQGFLDRIAPLGRARAKLIAAMEVKAVATAKRKRA